RMRSRSSGPRTERQWPRYASPAASSPEYAAWRMAASRSTAPEWLMGLPWVQTRQPVPPGYGAAARAPLGRPRTTRGAGPRPGQAHGPPPSHSMSVLPGITWAESLLPPHSPPVSLARQVADGGHELVVARELAESGQALAGALDVRPADDPVPVDEELP